MADLVIQPVMGRQIWGCRAQQCMPKASPAHFARNFLKCRGCAPSSENVQAI
jgi:hypothetical protein